MFVIYVFLQSLAVGVNTTIWSDNSENIAPVLCDISE